MANMRDALLKAGVISKKQKRQSEHQARQEKAVKVKTQVEERVDVSGGEEPAVEVERPSAVPVPEERQSEKLRDLIKKGRLDFAGGGRRRFYFVSRDGYLPFLPVSDLLAGRLERGEVAIVEDVTASAKVSRQGPTYNSVYDHTIVDKATVVQIAKAEPELVRFFRE